MARRTYPIDVNYMMNNLSSADLLVASRMLVKMVELWHAQKRAISAGDRLKVQECQVKMSQMLDAATVWRDTSGMKCHKRLAYRKAKLAAIPHRTTRLDPSVDDAAQTVFVVEIAEADEMASDSSADPHAETL